MLLAKVTDDTPLAVQVKGSASSVGATALDHVSGLLVDDDVLVEILDRRVFVVGKVP